MSEANHRPIGHGVGIRWLPHCDTSW